MKKYTDKEMDAIMDSVNFPDGFSTKQTFTVLLWSIFNQKKLNRFCWNIERGMSVYCAFEDALNNQIK